MSHNVALRTQKLEMKDAPFTVLLPLSALGRLDTLVPLIAEDPYYSIFGRATRTKTLRLALLAGTESLEARYRDGQKALQDRRDEAEASFQAEMRARLAEGGIAALGTNAEDFKEYPAGSRRLTLRLPVFLVRRLDGLIPALGCDPAVTCLVPRLTRSAALRYALAVGIGILEVKYLSPRAVLLPHPFVDMDLYAADGLDGDIAHGRVDPE